MTTRRVFLATLGLGTLAAPWKSLAQQPSGKAHRLGFLGSGSASSVAKPLEALRAGLRDLGYVEGRNIAIEYRWGEGRYERLPDFAADLIRLNVELIMAWGTPAIVAAKRATSTLPIVMAGAGDPVGAGLIASLARPGGNVTGPSITDVGLAAKRLELLREVLPKLSRVAVLRNPANPSGVLQFEETQTAARSLGIELQLIDVRDSKELESAFSAMVKARVGALTVLGDPLFMSQRNQIANLTIRSRLPSAFARNENAEAGGLISYGPTLASQFRQAATYVNKILKGAKPGDLPVEEPIKFELVINVKTAKALGITIPRELLLRADEVIE